MILSKMGLAGIQYWGEGGITQECLDAVVRLIQYDDRIKNVRILSSDNKHCLLVTIDNGDLIAIKSGFTTGYSGEGPRKFSYVLALLSAHNIKIDECEVEDSLLNRLDASALTNSDIKKINSIKPIGPQRFHEYIYSQHSDGSGYANFWESFRPVVPFAIIDSRIIDLAISFWENPDYNLIKGYKRLEDIFRMRTNLKDGYGSDLFIQSFIGDARKLHWKDINHSEQEALRFMSEIELLPENKKVKSLEEFLNNFRIYKLRGLKHNVVALDECIDRLGAIMQKNYNPLTARPSLDLEWYVSRSLMILNDAIKIAPSYNLGDDGIPTGFRANTSDIECYYDSFGMTVEVTLLLGRDQWIAEGQPVMRHFRDFEDKIDNDLAYCIFIAPLIHRDTLNTFWNGNKFGYEGERQNIIPLTLSQFIEILKIAKDKIANGILDHRSISGLFSIIAGKVDDINLPQEWVSEFSTIISEWS